MKTTARQFFDVWATATEAVFFARRYGAAPLVRAGVVRDLHERHGVNVAAEGAAYFDRLRADTTAHSAGERKP